MRLLILLSVALLLAACSENKRTPGLDEFSMPQQPTDSQHAAETAARI